MTEKGRMTDEEGTSVRYEEVMNSLAKGPLGICDSSSIGGEQAAGTVFASLEKTRIAKLLDGMGVQWIEANILVMGGDERREMRRITSLNLDAPFLGWKVEIISWRHLGRSTVKQVLRRKWIEDDPDAAGPITEIVKRNSISLERNLLENEPFLHTSESYRWPIRGSAG